MTRDGTPFDEFGQSELLVPFECTRCGAVKRDAEGRIERIPITVWAQYRPQVCPACYAVLGMMQRLRELVEREDDDSDV